MWPRSFRGTATFASNLLRCQLEWGPVLALVCWRRTDDLPKGTQFSLHQDDKRNSKRNIGANFCQRFESSTWEETDSRDSLVIVSSTRCCILSCLILTGVQIRLGYTISFVYVLRTMHLGCSGCRHLLSSSPVVTVLKHRDTFFNASC